MKITHHLHGWTPDTTDPEWAERVEREAERHTQRTEVAWRKAERRLAKTIEKAAIVEARPEVSRARKDRLWAVVDRRREELKALERIAHASPAGSQNRGSGSYRGVATGDPL